MSHLFHHIGNRFTSNNDNRRPIAKKSSIVSEVTLEQSIIPTPGSNAIPPTADIEDLDHELLRSYSESIITYADNNMLLLEEEEINMLLLEKEEMKKDDCLLKDDPLLALHKQQRQLQRSTSPPSSGTSPPSFRFSASSNNARCSLPSEPEGEAPRLGIAAALAACQTSIPSTRDSSDKTLSSNNTNARERHTDAIVSASECKSSRDNMMNNIGYHHEQAAADVNIPSTQSITNIDNSIGEKDSLFTVKSQRRCWPSLIVPILFAIVILATVAIVFFHLTNNKPEEMSPANYLKSSCTKQSSLSVSQCDILKELLSEIAPDSGKAIETMGTPQNLAFCWLFQKKFNPNLENYTEYNILQRYAAASFYFSTGGDSWNMSDRWASEAPICQWNSTEDDVLKRCDGSKLRILSLGNNGIEGVLPPELAHASSLLEVDLFENSLYGTLPVPYFMQLTNLRILNLYSNKLTGTMPTELGLLSNLESLDLDKNFLTGALPTEFSTLTALTSLWLNNNGFTGEIPSEIGLMTSLTHLFLQGNILTGKVPAEICELPDLEIQVGCSVECNCCLDKCRR